MGNWTVDTTPSAIASKAVKPQLDWTKLEQHLQEIGTLHTSAFRILRNLAPALVLAAYWFFKHPGLMFTGPAWWYIPRVSVLGNRHVGRSRVHFPRRDRPRRHNQ